MGLANLNTPFTMRIPREKNKYNILFKIIDTGNGIESSTQSMLNKILDMEETRKSAQKSSGMGLIISKRLAQLMDGHIWYETTRGLGTIFYFNIVCKGIDI